MPPTIPQSEPAQLVAGDTWEWDRTLADYPPVGGWTLTYAFRGPGSIDIEAGDNGTVHQVRVGANETAALPGGVYRWAGYVSLGGSRYQVLSGTVLVAPNLAEVADGGSHAARMLALIDAALEGRLQGGAVDEYTINGRSISRMPVVDLMKLRGQYAALVTQEQMQALGGRSFRRVEVTFRAPR